MNWGNTWIAYEWQCEECGIQDMCRSWRAADSKARRHHEKTGHDTDVLKQTMRRYRRS